MARAGKRETQTGLEAIASLANILVPISRVLIQRDLGAGPLVLAAKLAHLHAAMDTVGPRGMRPNVSRLSVVTGMTRKEVSSLLKYTANTVKGPVPRIALEQRALRVLRGWTSDPSFKTRTGRPADLDLRSDGPDFSSLVRAYGGDVTTASVLKELERINAVTRSPRGKIRLNTRKSRAHARSSAHLAEFAHLLKDFVDTTSQVIQPQRAPLYFGFRDSVTASSTQAALFQRTFARRAATLLASVEEWRARQGEGAVKTVARRSRNAMRVGLGVYLVQDDPAASDRAARRVSGPAR